MDFDKPKVYGDTSINDGLFSCINQQQDIIDTRTNLRASLKLEQSLSIIKTM